MAMKFELKKFFPQNKSALVFWILIIIMAFWLGRGTDNGNVAPEVGIRGESTAEIWTCSMHPQIQQPKPGKCPICGMDLIPLEKEESGGLGERQIRLSEYARKLAEIETAPVTRKFVKQQLRLVGKISVDETRLKYITAWVPGRIERMFVNYTGIPVKKGDHLAELYSPELVTTLQELKSARAALNSVVKQSPALADAAKQQIASIRERLRLWGLSEKQIQELEKETHPDYRITIYSPISGVVLEKKALEGDYVKTGSRIYTVADLSVLWVVLEAYESDIGWLHFGQKVSFTTESYPGEVFEGRISFISPLINPATRTVQVRVNLPNPDGKLKPDMLVHGIVESLVSANGKIMEPDLAGKWISPMHPEVVKDKPGKCDVCGMPLVRAEDLGYVTSRQAVKNAPLVVPASAVLLTGKRAVVYVAVPGENGLYEGREIVLGPRAGDYYLVKEGLEEGEEVVVRGNFKIDSAIQIQAGPSMMNPSGGESGSTHLHQHGQQSVTKEQPATGKILPPVPDKKFEEMPARFLEQLQKIYQGYLDLQYALSHDDFAAGKASLTKLTNAVSGVDMGLLNGDAHMFWMEVRKVMLNALQAAAAAGDLESLRVHFETLSKAVIGLAKAYGTADLPLYIYHCPMAFNNQGADWLQSKEGTENPYFGSAMFSCGFQKEEIAPAKQGDK